MVEAEDLNLGDHDDSLELSDLTDVDFDTASSVREIYVSTDVEKHIFSVSRQHEWSPTEKAISALVQQGYSIVSSNFGLDIDRIGSRLDNVDDKALHRLTSLNRDIEAHEFQRRHEQRGKVYEIEISEQCATDIKKYATDLARSENDIANFFLCTSFAALGGEFQSYFVTEFRKFMNQIRNLETLLAKVEVAETMDDEEYLDRAESI